MTKKIMMCMVAIAMSMAMFSITYGAQSGSVGVALPSFKVTMNGQTVNNDYSKYPLIVYKDITYFPMTYSDCRYLGIESTWKGDREGLLIDATGVTIGYNPYVSSSKNGKKDTAKISSFPIKVNGKSVDNSKEVYPLLSFRDITYFPMTWKYSVGEFGWDYSFDEKNGLTIKSKNMKLHQTDLPNDRPKEGQYSDFPGKKSSCVRVSNGYVYYDNNKGAIMQAPLSNTAKTKKIYQLEVNDYIGGVYDAHSFYEENGKTMLFFHSGGAVMGSDHRLELNSDGTTKEIQGGYDETTAYGNTLFMYWVGPMPGAGNLKVQTFGKEDQKMLGSKEYWYYGLTHVDGLPKVTLIGNQLYVKASKVLSFSLNEGYKLEREAVYKVDIDTNETRKVSHAQEQVLAGQIEGEHLYYLTRENNVYKVSLNDGSESLVGKAEMGPDNSPKFAVLGGNAYFQKEDNSLYMVNNSTSLNPKAELIGMSIVGDNHEYLACTFKESTDARYRMMIFDKDGKVVLKTSDCASNVVVEGSTVYFYNVTTEKICSGAMK